MAKIRTKIRTMAAFMKVDAHKRFGDDTSPAPMIEEEACHDLQVMVRMVNIQHKPLRVENFLDLADAIGELLRHPDGITSKLAAELTWILTREWERPWPMTPRPFTPHTFGRKVPRG